MFNMNAANIKSKNHQKSETVGVFLACVYLCMQLIPWVTLRVRGPVVIMVLAAWFLITIVPSISFFAKNNYLMKSLVSYLFFVIISSVYIIIQYTDDSWKYFIGFLYMISPLFIFSYYFFFNQIRNIKIITLASIFFMSICMVLSIKGLTIDPEASRHLTGGVGDDVLVYKYGIAGFSQIYAFALLVPAMLITTNHVKFKNKLFLLAVSILAIITVFKASYMISIICLLVGIFICVNGEQKIIRKKMLWVLSFLCAALFFVISFLGSVFAPLVQNIANMFTNNQVIYERLMEIENYLATGFVQGDSGERLWLYEKSWETFLSSPLYGDGLNSPGIGGHSQILDTLGKQGLLGFIPLLMFFYFVNKYFTNTVYNKSNVHINNSFSWIFIFLSFINPSFSPDIMSVYLLILPGLSLFFENKIKTGQLV